MLTFVEGDPLLTQAQMLAFGHNALGRTETGRFETELMVRYPAAFASYSRQCHQGRIKPGVLWGWREAQPALGFMVVRASAVGATRLRYVEQIVLSLARDHRREGLSSIALYRLGDVLEWPYIKPVLEQWLHDLPIPCIVYESYRPGVAAE